MAYATKSDVEQYSGLTIASSLDAFITTCISTAQLYIEKYTGRFFEPPSPDNDVTKYFDGNGATRMRIGDFRSITTLELDGEALVADEDYYKYPLNATAEGKPFEWIELIQPETRVNTNSRVQVSAPYVFEKAQKNVKVVGKFNWAAVPSDVKIAVLKIVGGIIKENIGDNDLKEITQESLGEYSVSFAKVSEVANRLGVNDLLDQYKATSLRAKSGFIKAS